MSNQADEHNAPFDLSPGTPGNEKEWGQDREKAIHSANFGDGEHINFDYDLVLVPPTLAVDYDKVEAFLQACMTSHPRVTYGLGKKVPSLTAVPGRDFTQVDCSGFVRAALQRSTTPPVAFPDGSYIQHEWVKSKGYAPCTIADGSLKDGKVRIAFLEPTDSGDGIGHVVLIRNGMTAESHGHVGPDSRPFNGTGWQAKAKVYILRD